MRKRECRGKNLWLESESKMSELFFVDRKNISDIRAHFPFENFKKKENGAFQKFSALTLRTDKSQMPFTYI